MTEGAPTSRRRSDRVVQPDLVSDLEHRPLDEVRSLRDDCRAEEARLSYVRRLLQGRLDILRAEATRRSEGTELDVTEWLPRVLADSGAPSGALDARSSPFYEEHPLDGAGRRAFDEVFADGSLAALPRMQDEELHEVVERLAGQERSVSDVRRVVLRHLDALQAELMRRYRSGEIGVDAVVAASSGDDERA